MKKKAKAKAKRKPARRQATPIRRAARWVVRMLLRTSDDWWRSAGGVVVNHKREVALIRQGSEWTFPKGRLDPGEGVTRAARREVHEEAGLRTRIIGYLGVVEGQRHETHYFLMTLEADDEVHDDEVDEVKFTHRDKAERLLTSRTDRRLLRDALALLRKS